MRHFSLFLFLLVNAASLFAEKKDPPVTGTVTFMTDYRDRGISQTKRDLAIQGDLKYVHEKGYYVKIEGTNVDGTGNFLTNTSLELDIFLGYTGKYFNTRFKVDCGFEIYVYPGGRALVPRYVDYNSVEYFFALSYKDFDIQFHQTITDYFGVNSKNPPINWAKRREIRPNGSSIGSPYIEVNYTFPIYKKLKCQLHAGYQGIINYPQLNFFDWLLSITYPFEWFDFSVSYVQSTGRLDYYKVPNSLYHPRRINLAGPGAYAVITHTF